MKNIVFMALRELAVMQFTNVVSQGLFHFVAVDVAQHRDIHKDVHELFQAFGAIFRHGQIIGQILKEFGDQTAVNHFEGGHIALSDDSGDVAQGLPVVRGILADLEDVHRRGEPMDDLQGVVRRGRRVREVSLTELSSLNLNPFAKFHFLLRRENDLRGLRLIEMRRHHQ